MPKPKHRQKADFPKWLGERARSVENMINKKYRPCFCSVDVGRLVDDNKNYLGMTLNYPLERNNKAGISIEYIKKISIYIVLWLRGNLGVQRITHKFNENEKYLQCILMFKTNEEYPILEAQVNLTEWLNNHEKAGFQRPPYRVKFNSILARLRKYSGKTLEIELKYLKMTCPKDGISDQEFEELLEMAKKALGLA